MFKWNTGLCSFFVIPEIWIGYQKSGRMVTSGREVISYWVGLCLCVGDV